MGRLMVKSPRSCSKILVTLLIASILACVPLYLVTVLLSADDNPTLQAGGTESGHRDGSLPTAPHDHNNLYDGSLRPRPLRTSSIEIINQNDLSALDTITDYTTRVQELLRMRNSLLNELREREKEKIEMEMLKSSVASKVDDLKGQKATLQWDIDRLQLTRKQMMMELKEEESRKAPFVAPPLRLVMEQRPLDLVVHSDPSTVQKPDGRQSIMSCTNMETCWDYSRCPLVSEQFTVFLYDNHETDQMTDLLRDILASSIPGLELVSEPESACAFVAILSSDIVQQSATEIVAWLDSLSHFNSQHDKMVVGRNHILINLNNDIDLVAKLSSTSSFSGYYSLAAIVIQPHWELTTKPTSDHHHVLGFRSGFDLVLPYLPMALSMDPILGSVGISNSASRTRLCPARRKYLATFHTSSESASKSDSSSRSQSQTTIITTLRNLADNSHDDLFEFSFNCDTSPQQQQLQSPNQDLNQRNTLKYNPKFNQAIIKQQQQQSSCGNYSGIMSQSTFTLLIPGRIMGINNHDHHQLLRQLYTILREGSIPVIVGSTLTGGTHLRLPLDEVLDWHRAAILLPVARLPELHLILKSITDQDLIALRQAGQLIFDRYLSSTDRMIHSLMAFIRQGRLQMAPPPAAAERSVSFYNSTHPMPTYEVYSTSYNTESGEPEESLGPIEPPFPSPAFQQNFTTSLSMGYRLWNSHHLLPFHMYPQTPFSVPTLPTEAQFIGSSYGFRPINEGAGGAGREFSEALGGNQPREQFTVVILTYEREAVLIDTIQRLKGVPHLNKVLVVWNSATQPPSRDLVWPAIGVPVVVVRTSRNSLNNRFLPYDEIETEAILSMDDDVHLRPDEIVLAFRAWRESRDRIVGFPARFHAWDADGRQWNYNSNYTCQLSMVLTGAAFFHKYYTYIYSQVMPQEIRDKVDEYMNCEDIAMNFLVSHVTRSPPVKVTSRWTFRCPGCAASLSESDSHFLERHLCMNYFTAIYGYNPLLNTQLRADSVLFKTRIPHDKQKCFKYV